MASVKHLVLVRADLSSIDEYDDYGINELQGELRYEVQELARQEMKRAKSKIANRTKVAKVKKSYSYSGK